MQTSAPLLHNMPSTQRSFPNVGIRAGEKDLVGGAGGGLNSLAGEGWDVVDCSWELLWGGPLG